MEEEQAVADEIDEDESDDDDDKPYNPLKLPLGWDGKPIPFWLYKLHGLGVEYPCEICGNYVYRGRKAFDKHFQVRDLHCFHCAPSYGFTDILSLIFNRNIVMRTE